MGKILCIISSAYLKEGMQAEFGKIPPAFVPLHNKPIFEHQINTIGNQYNKIFLSLPEKYKIEPSIQILLQQKKVQTVEISPRLSVSEVIIKILKNIVTINNFNGATIIFGDTVIKNYKDNVSDTYSCHTPKTNQNWAYLDTYNNKVFSGLLNLSEATCRAIIDGKLGTSFINNKSIFSILKPNKSGSWYDIGHVSEYIRTRSRYDTSRSFNILKINDLTVTKTSSDHFKINSEIFWYENLPQKLKLYSPHILSSYPSKGEYILEKLPLISLAEIYSFGDQKQFYWKQVFSNIKKVLEDFSTHISPAPKIDYSSWVKYKTLERINNLPNKLKKYYNTEFKINGKKVPSINNLYHEINNKFDNLDLFETSNDVVTHGDLCFSNIFYDLRLGLIKLIDPRGFFADKKYSTYGNQTYDIVKLAHSVTGFYDYIIAKQYILEFKDNDLSYTILPKSNRQNIIYEFEKEILLPLNVCEKKLNANLFHLFLSMIPLHSDQEENQIIFLGQAYYFGFEALKC